MKKLILIPLLLFAAVIFSGCINPPPIGDNSPLRTAAEIVKSHKSMPSSYGESHTVQFTDGLQLSSSEIARESNAGLNSSQICLSKGNLEENSNFTIINGENLKIQYSGNPKEIKLGIICDDGDSLLEDFNEWKSIWKSNPVIVCPNGTAPSGTQMYCAILLKN